MNLTPHFTLDEMIGTTHLEFMAEQRKGAMLVLASLTAVAQMLEQVRIRFGSPIDVHSGYRCPGLNAEIGGNAASQHMLGQAADFEVRGVPLADVHTWIWRDSGLAYGQCLLEGRRGREKTWVHLSVGEPWRPMKRNRQHFLVST